MSDNTDNSVTRRDVMKGFGGMAALSMSNVTIAEAQDVMNEPLRTDPHTRDTYRAIVDAVLPETPQLEDELGSEHVPGGLAVELEKFLIWDFNHFQEIRSEQITKKESPAGAKMPASRFETEIDLTGEGTPLDALLTDVGGDYSDANGSTKPEVPQKDTPDANESTNTAGIGEGADTDTLSPNDNTESEVLQGDSDVDSLDAEDDTLTALEPHLDFGPVERLEIAFDNLDTSTEGPASFERTVVADGQPHQRVLENYPYAVVFPFAFDLAAADFLARGENYDQPSSNDQFAGGGTFVRLSREDRLRCLWNIVDGGTIDRLDTVLSPLLTDDVGLLKFVVMAVNGLHGFGYYTEWSGYGDTKTDAPSERELEVEEGEVQSRLQTGYPGPANGYAADWRHLIEGGFNDRWEPVDGGEGEAGVSGDPSKDTSTEAAATESADGPAGGEVPDAVEGSTEGDLS